MSLQLWFFAIYLMSSTRCGISAKQLEREIGVTYKTAHRMFKQIRTLLSDDDEGPLSGRRRGGRVGLRRQLARQRNSQRSYATRRSYRPTILAMVERGGRVRGPGDPDRGAPDDPQAVKQHVLPSSMLFTDEWDGLQRECAPDYEGHRRIKHRLRSTRSARPTRRRSRASSACSRTACAASTTRSAATTSRAYLDEYALPLQPAQLRAADVLGDAQPRPEGKPELLPSPV